MMMETAEEHLDEPTPSVGDPRSDGLVHDEKRMVFFRRPDLSGQQLLFQRPRGGRGEADESRQHHATPAQLVTLDGQSKLGIPVHSHSSRSPGGSAGGHRSAAVTPERGARRERLPRLLVTSNALDDDASKTRLRRLRISVVIGALVDMLATTVLLAQDGQDAWFHVDAFASVVGTANSERVRSVRGKLIAIASLCNLFAIVAAHTTSSFLQTLYPLVLVISDLWSLVLLLPHPFFLLRFMLDMVLIGLVGEIRSNLENAWFLSSFHRLRH